MGPRNRLNLAKGVKKGTFLPSILSVLMYQKALKAPAKELCWALAHFVFFGRRDMGKGCVVGPSTLFSHKFIGGE